MPSQEERMLDDFLLAPATLRDFVTLRQFTDVFPRAHRSNSAVQDLYRELQILRERDVDVVRREIAEEVRRSKRLRREYAQERRRLDNTAEVGLDSVARQMEDELSGPIHREVHTLHTVHADIEQACQSLEAQIATLEQETNRCLHDIHELVGGLSDLRQGRFAQSASGQELAEEVRATLTRLNTVCSEAVE